MNTAPQNAVQPPQPPPPPLHLCGQQAEQQQQQQQPQGNMLYNVVEYVTDAATGNTLMAL